MRRSNTSYLKKIHNSDPQSTMRSRRFTSGTVVAISGSEAEIDVGAFLPDGTPQNLFVPVAPGLSASAGDTILIPYMNDSPHSGLASAVGWSASEGAPSETTHTRAHNMLTVADHADVATYLDQAVLAASSPAFVGLTINDGGVATGDLRAEADTEANMLFLDASADKLYLGGSTNGIEIAKGGELTLLGDATVWDDIRIVPGAFVYAGVADPTLVNYQPGGSGATSKLFEFKMNDVGYFTVQVPHGYKVGTDISAHVHWTPGLRGNEENGATVGWKILYSWANADGTFAAMGTADCSDACNGVDHEHNMSPEVTIDGHTAAKSISSMLICQITRTDTGTDDTWASTTSGQLPMLLEVDFHFQSDTMGSKLSTAK
jgi:hypothetical protein